MLSNQFWKYHKTKLLISLFLQRRLKMSQIKCLNSIRLLLALIHSPKRDDDAKSELDRQTGEHVKLNVPDEDKCESHY